MRTTVLTDEEKKYYQDRDAKLIKKNIWWIVEDVIDFSPGATFDSRTARYTPTAFHRIIKNTFTKRNLEILVAILAIIASLIGVVSWLLS